MTYFNEIGGFDFEKYGCDAGVHFNFESGEFNCTQEKLCRLSCVVLAILAIMVSVGILYSSNDFLPFLHNVDHKWAWIMIGAAGATLLPNVVFLFSLIHKHLKFVNEAKGHMGGWHRATMDCPHLFKQLEGRATEDQWYESGWAEKWNEGSNLKRYIYIEKGVKTVTLVNPSVEEAFKAKLAATRTYTV